MADLSAADVVAMKRYLTDASDAVHRWLPGLEWAPGWHSEAAVEQAASLTGPAGPWGDVPVRTVYAVAAVFLETVLQCLRAMASALTEETTPYVPNCLARSALEAGSQAWWLLERGIGARRRVARFVLVRAGTASSLRESAKKLGVPPDDYGQTVDAVRASAAALGLDLVSADGGKRWSCEADCLPTYNARAANFERALSAYASYSIYSASAHAEWHAVIAGWQVPEVPEDAKALVVCRPDRVAVWSAVLNSVNISLEVSRQALELLGRRARLIDLGHWSGEALSLMRRMDLPREWWSDYA